MNSKQSVQHLVKGCQQGNPSSQRELVDRFSGMLYTVCIRYIGDEHKAKDALQESLIRVFKSIQNFDPNKGSLEGWMRKITVNNCLKQLGKYKMERSPISESMDHWYQEAEVISQLNANDLLEQVKTLPDGYREIFNLSVIEGYSHKEIGEKLNIAEVTSRSQLSRAKQLLRKKLTSITNTKLSCKKIV